MPELYTGGDFAPRNLFGKIALSIASRVHAALFRPVDAPAAPDKPEPSEGGMARILDFFSDIRKDLDRYEAGRRSWIAYDSDERLSAAMDGLAEHATARDNEGNVFRLVLAAENPDPEMVARFEVLESKVEQLRLQALAEPMILRGCLEGDAYLQIIPNASLDGIADVCISDGAREGRVWKKLRDRATKEFAGWAVYDKASGERINVYAPWEIKQASRKRTGAYGIPMLKSGRITIDRLERLEESMVRARESRAYAKHVHHHEGASKPQLDQLLADHVERIKKFGRGVDSDIFTSGDVTVIDPNNAQLSRIDDVKYLELKMLTGTRTPPGLLGHDVANRAVLDKQEEVFVRMLAGISSWVSDTYREVLDLQLILMGIVPEDVPYKLVWTDKSSQDLKGMADSLSILVNDCKLDPITAQEEAGFDPELSMARWEQWNAWQAEMDRKSGQEPQPTGGNGNGNGKGNGNGNGGYDSNGDPSANGAGDGAATESWLQSVGGHRGRQFLARKRKKTWTY